MSSNKRPNDWADAEEATDPTPVVFIIGAGVVGSALALRLLRAGVPVAGLHGRETGLSDAAGALSGVLATSGDLPPFVSESDVVIISVRDERIPEVASRLVKEKRLRRNQVLLQTSGTHAAGEVLQVAAGKVRGLGTLHPLLSFTRAELAARALSDAAFGIEGDASARAMASRLVRLVGGRPITLDSTKMALYHAGAVMASNYVVALANVARNLLMAASVKESEALPALIPLLTSAVENLGAAGLPEALTGPVVRGDVDTVERHLDMMEAKTPAALDLYKMLGREVLAMARQKRPQDAATTERLAALFGPERRRAPRPSKPRR